MEDLQGFGNLVIVVGTLLGIVLGPVYYRLTRKSQKDLFAQFKR